MGNGWIFANVWICDLNYLNFGWVLITATKFNYYDQTGINDRYTMKAVENKPFNIYWFINSVLIRICTVSMTKYIFCILLINVLKSSHLKCHRRFRIIAHYHSAIEWFMGFILTPGKLKSQVAVKSCECCRPWAECIITAPGPWWGEILILSWDESPLCTFAGLRVDWGRMHSNDSSRGQSGHSRIPNKDEQLYIEEKRMLKNR